MGKIQWFTKISISGKPAKNQIQGSRNSDLICLHEAQECGFSTLSSGTLMLRKICEPLTEDPEDTLPGIEKRKPGLTFIQTVRKKEYVEAFLTHHLMAHLVIQLHLLCCP